jgi:hypothetical protein
MRGPLHVLRDALDRVPRIRRSGRGPAITWSGDLDQIADPERCRAFISTPLPAFARAADDRHVVPRHTLVHLTDLHLLPEGRLLRDRLDTFDALARTLATIERSELRPAALLFTGDLTEAGEPAAYQRLRALVEPVAARMGTASLYVMGNHDSRPELRQHLLGESRNEEPYDYTVRLDGLRIVVLDTTVPEYSHGELTSDQLHWLAAQLAEPAPHGTVLALHHPPLPTPSRIAAAIELRNRKDLNRRADRARRTHPRGERGRAGRDPGVDRRHHRLRLRRIRSRRRREPAPLPHREPRGPVRRLPHRDDHGHRRRTHRHAHTSPGGRSDRDHRPLRAKPATAGASVFDSLDAPFPTHRRDAAHQRPPGRERIRTR